MTNTEISNNNPEKASIEDKSISDDKPNKLVRNIQRKIKKLHQNYLTCNFELKES